MARTSRLRNTAKNFGRGVKAVLRNCKYGFYSPHIVTQYLKWAKIKNVSWLYSAYRRDRAGHGEVFDVLVENGQEAADTLGAHRYSEMPTDTFRVGASHKLYDWDTGDLVYIYEAATWSFTFPPDMGPCYRGSPPMISFMESMMTFWLNMDPSLWLTHAPGVTLLCWSIYGWVHKQRLKNSGPFSHIVLAVLFKPEFRRFYLALATNEPEEVQNWAIANWISVYQQVTLLIRDDLMTDEDFVTRNDLLVTPTVRLPRWKDYCGGVALGWVMS